MVKCDYLIIGGGISGITLKHFLKNKRTVLLEAEPGRYKIGESIIPEHFRHPELHELIPAMERCPSFSPKAGTTFIADGNVVSFPVPPGKSTGAMHITRTEMEEVMLRKWGDERTEGRVVAVDLEKKIVRTEDEEYQVAFQIIDCSGPNMVLANLLKQTKILWPVCTTWGYWNVERSDPKAFHDAIRKRRWNWLSYHARQRRVLPEEARSWDPARSTVLTKVADGVWTWQIPLFHHKLLSYGVVRRGGPISRKEYYEICRAQPAPNYRLKPRELDGSGIYNRLYVRNNFARSAAVAATMDYISLSDAFCFADPIYSVGTGLAVNKAIEVAVILNDTGWTPEICKAYCDRYARQLRFAVDGFQFWYDGKLIKDDEAASTVQSELLVGNAFQSNITYHYAHSINSGDLPAKLYPAQRFTVDWSDPRIDKTTAAVTKAAGGLLGLREGGMVGRWRFSKAWPAVGGLLLAWKGGGRRPDLRLLLSKAGGDGPIHRTVDSMSLSCYLEERWDKAKSLRDDAASLVDELLPQLARRSEDWKTLLNRVLGEKEPV